jgi:predicted DNA-binding transcriptional regulator AlpA
VTDRLVTARELGEAIGLKPSTVLDKWERGEFPGYRFGRAVRFDLDEILELGRRSRLTGQSRPRQQPAKVLG